MRDKKTEKQKNRYTEIERLRETEKLKTKRLKRPCWRLINSVTEKLKRLIA